MGNNGVWGDDALDVHGEHNSDNIEPSGEASSRFVSPPENDEFEGGENRRDTNDDDEFEHKAHREGSSESTIMVAPGLKQHSVGSQQRPEHVHTEGELYSCPYTGCVGYGTCTWGTHPMFRTLLSNLTRCVLRPTVVVGIYIVLLLIKLVFYNPSSYQ